MKKLVLPLAVLLLLGAAGCKTTEANYRTAYEKAKEKKISEKDEDDAKLMDLQRPRMTAFGADTLPVRSFYIGYTRDGGADKDHSVVKGFCVVVGQFKQVFNARSMRQRLIADGYADALVVNDNMKNYYVVATTSNNAHQASLDLERVNADKKLVLKPPFPYVLLPGHLHRR